jgi:dTDP-4-dehydrorhamnose 3,5-epimerase
MKITSITPLAIPEVQVLRFGRFMDFRGYFTEIYRRSDLRNHPAAGSLSGVEIVQGNASYSRANVIRGMHFQWNPRMGKLVRTLAGRMVDLFLDIRKGSPTLGKIAAYDMPASCDRDYDEWIWVPPGFAHGNYFTEPSLIEYLCSGEYSGGCEAGISPLSPDLDWSLCGADLKSLFDQLAAGALMTDKDRGGMTVTQWLADPRSENFVYGSC